MTDHFDFNFGNSTVAKPKTQLDTLVEFPFYPVKKKPKSEVLVLSEEYRIPKKSLPETN